MIEIFVFFKKETVAIIALIVSIVALAITWKKNIYDRKNTDDKDLMNQLNSSLENAYNSIAEKSENNFYPVSDRVKWLTAARHITRYYELKKNLKTELFKTICEEQEDYYRTNFYYLLEEIEGIRFFGDISIENKISEKIAPVSAAIIYSFSSWQEGKEDPIADIDFVDFVVKNNLWSPMYRHFREYIRECYPRRAEQIQDLITNKYNQK